MNLVRLLLLRSEVFEDRWAPNKGVKPCGRYADQIQEEGKWRENVKRLALAAAMLGVPTFAAAGDGWTGFYLGANVGYSDAKVSSGPVSFSDDDWSYGLQAGYNYALLNSWVLGGEVSYNTAQYTILDVTGDIDTTRLKFKAGYDTGGVLVYGVLGYASLDDGEDREDGVTYGLGIGYKPIDRIIVTGEVLRDSGDFDGIDFDQTVFNLGISYQF